MRFGILLIQQRTGTEHGAIRQFATGKDDASRSHKTIFADREGFGGLPTLVQIDAVRSPSGKTVTQLRVPIEDFSSILRNEIPLHIVRLPMRELASICPKNVIRIIRRRRHGKIKRSTASSLFIRISQVFPLLQNFRIRSAQALSVFVFQRDHTESV